MPIKLVHQPAPGVVGMAAYASGYGKAREREKKQFQTLYRDEQKRRERRMEQFRGFSYQTALEGMRQGAMDLRAGQRREQDLMDRAEDRGYVEMDQETRRQQQIDDEERRRKQAIEDRDEGRAYAHDEEERLRKIKEARERRDAYDAGELEFHPDTQAKLDELERNKAQAYADHDLDDPALGGDNFFGMEKARSSRDNIVGQIDADIEGLLGSAKPKKRMTPTEQFGEDTVVDDHGNRYTPPDKPWRKITDGEGAKQLDALEKQMKAMENETYEEGDKEGDYMWGDDNIDAWADEAQNRLERKRRAMGKRLGIRQPGRGREQGVPPRPGQDQTGGIPPGAPRDTRDLPPGPGVTGTTADPGYVPPEGSVVPLQGGEPDERGPLRKAVDSLAGPLAGTYGFGLPAAGVKVAQMLGLGSGEVATYQTDDDVSAAMESGQLQPGQEFIGPDGKKYKVRK